MANNVRPYFANGEWVVGKGPTLESVNPFNGDIVATVSTASREDVDAVVNAARAAFEKGDWSRLKPHMRARTLHAMGQLIDAERETLAKIQMSDNGKTLTECRGALSAAADTFRYFAAVCETFEGEVNPSRGAYLALTVYEPIGVVAAITPWNSPAMLEAQKLAPILAAGNSVVLKPSDVSPLIGLEYARLAERAGFPKGVVNVISGGAAVGAALVEHPDVDMISFTGGAKTGRSIAATAGGLLKPVNLELGGKSPNIVFADVDLDPTIARVADAIFSSGGQSCTAGSRIFVEEKIYKPVLAGLNEFARNYRMGDPASSDTDMGPLASFAHREKVASYIDIGKAEGAKIEVGGYVPSEALFAKGAFYPATVMTEVDNRARVSSEEIFGPVAVVLPFRDEEDVIAQANDTPYGLAAGLWTADPRRAVRIASNLRAGTVWVNTFKQFSIATPFGGMKQSGIGREKGIQGMRVYMAAKGIYLAD